MYPRQLKFQDDQKYLKKCVCFNQKNSLSYFIDNQFKVIVQLQWFKTNNKNSLYLGECKNLQECLQLCQIHLNSLFLLTNN